MATHTELFHRSRAEAGLSPSSNVVRLLEVSCGVDAADAEQRCRPYLLEKYAHYASWGLEGLSLDRDASPSEPFQALAVYRFVVGDPETVIAGLLTQYEIGMRHLSMRVSWPGMPQKDILAGIERLGRDVLPEVRRLSA